MAKHDLLECRTLEVRFTQIAMFESAVAEARIVQHGEIQFAAMENCLVDLTVCRGEAG